MGDVRYLNDYSFPWREVFSREDFATDLQIYINDRTGDVEVVQVNAEGEALTTCLSADDVQNVLKALMAQSKKPSKQR